MATRSTVQRKSNSSRIVRRRSIKNYGTTGNYQGMIEPDTVAKGLFGYSDLSTFRDRSYMTVDMQSVTESMSLPVVSPVFPLKQLSQLYVSTLTLRECVEAYVTNIESYGHKFEYIGPEGRRESAASQREYKMLQSIFETISHGPESFDDMRKRSRVDKEVMGARAFEVIEDAAGRVVGLNRIPTNTLLLTQLEKEPIEVEVYNHTLRRFVVQKRRFRRYLQRDIHKKNIYFKEWGDPRSIDPQTGQENDELPIEEQATAIYYDSYYTPGSPYGTPQWAGCIPSMLGSREAEMVNLRFFRDNAIPAMAVLVSGGALTEESFEKIEDYFTGSTGQESMHRIVVLEASSDEVETAGVETTSQSPKVDLKPMLSERQHEGLFANYIETASEKIRQSFRLPPIYVGSAEEYNRASAFASMQIAEQQVFVPERMSWDMFMQECVLSQHALRYWRYRSISPSYNDPQEISQLMNVFGQEGALTPNVCIELSNRYLNTSIESITEDWGDMPFAATLVNLNRGQPVEGFDYLMNTLGQVGSDENDDDDDPVETGVRNTIADAVDRLQKTSDRVL